MSILPQKLFLEITTECNLRCKLCKFWQNKDPGNKIDLTAKINFLKKVINWLERNDEEFQNYFDIILTGGEPFLYRNQVLKIAKLCKNNDISCYINTNGSIIGSNLKKILNSGLKALTISIDSHNAQVYDFLRGSMGLFNQLIEVLRNLKQKKDRNNFPIKLCVQSILGGWNINSLAEHIEFFQDLGIDGIMFQPIQYPFGLPIPEGWHKHFDKYPHSEEDIQNTIKYILSLKKDNSFVMNSKEEVELWLPYFRNPEYMSKKLNPCKAYEQNLIVDVCGNVKFCFNKEIKPKNKIGNILTTSIEELWNGKNASKEKKTLRSCNRACGIMACHIDTNLREV